LGVDESDPCRCIDAPPRFDRRFRNIGFSAFELADDAFAMVRWVVMGIPFSLVMGRGVVDVGWGPLLDGLFLRKSWLSLTFWMAAFLLKTEGFAGVERGVGGFEVPSMGALSPVLGSFGSATSCAGSARDCDSVLSPSVWSLLSMSCN
jgi:hypothetical protein